MLVSNTSADESSDRSHGTSCPAVMSSRSDSHSFAKAKLNPETVTRDRYGPSMGVYVSTQNDIMATCQVYNILDRSLLSTSSPAFSYVPLNDLAPWGIPHRAFMSWSNLANAIEAYSCEFSLTWRLRTAARMSPVRMSRTSMNRPSRTTNIAFLSSSKFQSSFTEHHF